MPNTPRYTLDTTILYEQWNMNAEEFLKVVGRDANGQRYTLYYCLYEFKMGLIKYWVEYFRAVEQLRDIPQAVIMAGEKYGRGSNKFAILMASLHRLNETIPAQDIDEYLCQLEVAIRQANTGFNYICKQLIGSFGKHPIFKASESLTRENYAAFLQVCEDNKYVDITSLLDSKRDDLVALVNYLKARVKELRLKKDWGILQETIDALEPLIVNSSRYKNRKKHVGDTVIALDAPKEHTLYSKDKLHEELARGLNKKHKGFSRT